MSRLTDRNNWFEIWFDDKNSMLDTMIRNMNSDLEAGYSYLSKSIRDQLQMIDDYRREFEQNMKEFRYMQEKDVNRWCYYDMKRRGVIE